MANDNASHHQQESVPSQGKDATNNAPNHQASDPQSQCKSGTKRLHQALLKLERLEQKLQAQDQSIPDQLSDDDIANVNKAFDKLKPVLQCKKNIEVMNGLIGTLAADESPATKAIDDFLKEVGFVELLEKIRQDPSLELELSP